MSESKFKVGNSEDWLMKLVSKTDETQGDVKATNDDEHFPTIGVTIDANMRADAAGWVWTCRIHMIGPDDIIEWKSEPFKTKRACAYALMGEFQDRVEKLWEEYNRV